MAEVASRVNVFYRMRRVFRGKSWYSPREKLLHLLPTRSIGAEIGVHEGDFSADILKIIKPRMLHLIDPWKRFKEQIYSESWYGGKGEDGQAMMDRRYQGVLERFSAEIAQSRIVVHRCLSQECASQFEDESLGWVYIDGNHLREFVMQDLKLYYPKVKHGGLIAGDDYGLRGWWDNGVQEAVDEFVRERPDHRLKVIDHQFIIYKPVKRFA